MRMSKVGLNAENFVNVLDQKTIADTVGVTEVTIRNRYKELAKNLDIVVYLWGYFEI